MEIPSSASAFNAVLGQGYNVEQERFSGQCVKGNTIFIGAQQAFATFDKSLSSSSLSKSLGFEVGAKARYGAISGSASAKFLSQASENSYSEVTVYSSQITFKNAKLNPPSVELTKNVGEKVKKDGDSFVWDNWEKVCGHEFVDQITLGATLYICARIEFSTRDAKQEFKAKLNIKGPAFQVSGKLKTASSDFAGKASIVISAYQLGGNVARLNTIFDATTDVDGKEVNPLLVCSFDNPEPCLEIFNEMLKYATDRDDPNAFPQQLNSGELDTSSPSGPAELAYLTAPWSDLAFLPPPPLIKDLVQNSRNELSNLFEENYDMQNRINNLKNLNIRLSPRQRQNIDEVENQVVSNLNQIIDVADICYSNPEQCPISVNDLKIKLTKIDRSKLDIFPETFSQWYAIKDLPSTLKATRNLVDGIVARFRNNFVDFDAIEEKGLELEKLLSTLEELNLNPFPNQDPSWSPLDFRPIANLSNLKKLYIRDQKIKDLSFLMGLDKLEELYLTSNAIEDLSPISALTKLKVLELSFNNIQNISALKSLEKLETLTLSDNKISDLSAIRKMNNLELLGIPNNKITDLQPLEALVKLQFLGLDGNQIEDVSAISKLPSLAIVTLEDNNIRDISPLNQLMTLRGIALKGNPISLQSNNKISIATRQGYFFSSVDDTGNISAIDASETIDNVIEMNDVIFTLIKFGGDGKIKSGDKIMIKTRQGFFFNSFDSKGNVSAIETANESDPEISDEIFTIIKFGDDEEIKTGDKIMIKTRRGFFFNSFDSKGNVSAIETANETDPEISDEIFTIDIVKSN